MKTLQIIVLLFIITASFYLFLESFLVTLLIEFQKAFIPLGTIYHQPVFLILFSLLLLVPMLYYGIMAILKRKRQHIKSVGVLIAFLCFPSILTASDFNWFLFINRNFQFSPSITGLNLLILLIGITIGYLFLSNMIWFSELKKNLLQQGATYDDVNKHTGETIIISLLPLSIILSAGIMYSTKLTMTMLTDVFDQLAFKLWIIGIISGILLFISLYLTVFLTTEKDEKDKNTTDKTK